MQGENDPKTHEVRLDIANASDFAAHLNIPGDAARTALGKYFLGLMQTGRGFVGLCARIAELLQPARP